MYYCYCVYNNHDETIVAKSDEDDAHQAAESKSFELVFSVHTSLHAL